MTKLHVQKLQNSTSSSTVKVLSCGLPLDFYSLSGEEAGALGERGVEVTGPGFQQGVNGVYTLDLDILYG